MAFPDEERRSPDPRGQLPIAFLCLLAAMALLHLPSDVQDDVARGLRGTILQPFVAVQEQVTRSRVRRAEVDDLRMRMDSLVARSTALESLAEENRRLRDLLDLRDRAEPDFVSASVVRPGTRGAESIFVVDVGSDDGVRRNAPVIAANGLVGVIREVSAGHAVGMDWTHPDFRASVMTEGGEHYGLAQPNRGPFRETDELLLAGLPYHAHVEPSTPIVTSGLGGIYPRGLLVGRVAEVHEEGAGWRRSYRLRPAVEVGGSTHVLVLTGDALPGRDLDGIGPEADEEDDFAFLWLTDAMDSGLNAAGLARRSIPGLPGLGAGSEATEELSAPEELEGPPDPEAPPAAGADGGMAPGAGLPGAGGRGAFGLPTNPVGTTRTPRRVP